MTVTIHYSDWSGQPDVHLACGRWTTPSWSIEIPLEPGLYIEDDGDGYTFEHKHLVNCSLCLAWIARRAEAPVIARALLDRIAARLALFKFTAISEADLQVMVHGALTSGGLECSREVTDGLNRYDMVVSRTGVRVVLELKVTGTAPAVERQAQRYALSSGVDGVCVVTSSSRMARTIAHGGDQYLAGKPFMVIHLRSL